MTILSIGQKWQFSVLYAMYQNSIFDQNLGSNDKIWEKCQLAVDQYDKFD